MTLIDSAIIITWLIIVFIVGTVSGFKEDLEGFWVNRRKTSKLPLIFTIVATQVGAGTVVGITSSTFSNGTGFGLVALASTVFGFFAVGLIAPWLKRFGDKYKAITLPEILKARYGRQTQVIASLVIVFTYLSLLAGQFIALSTLVGEWTGWDIKLAMVLAVGGLIVYTAFAGLKGDIATDILNFFMTSVSLFFILFPAILQKAPSSSILFDSIPGNIWSPVTFGGYPYLVIGVLLGAVIPLVSMELWMRVYASTHEEQAKSVFKWSSLLVIPFYLLPIIIGLIAYKIYPQTTNADSVLYKMMIDFLPEGLLGLTVGGIFAVVLSSANTMIIVIGATIYRDILGRDSSNGSITYSRYITAGVGTVGALYALATPDIVQLMLNAFFVIAGLSPALFGVAYWKRATHHGATWSIALGALTTIVFLFIMPRQAFLPGIVIAILAFVLVSLFTKHTESESIEPLLLNNHIK